MRHTEDAAHANLALEGRELVGHVARHGIDRAEVALVLARRRRGLLDLDGIERAVLLEEQVDLLPVIVAEEEKRRPRAGVDEALVDLTKGIGLEKLPA